MSDGQGNNSGPAGAEVGPAAPSGSPTAPEQARGQLGRVILGVILSAIVVGGGLAFLAVDSLESASYYHTLAEVAEAGEALVGESFRVAGVVEPGSLRTEQGAQLLHRFVIAEEGHRLAVRYERALPDAFTDNQEVVVEGTLQSRDTFHATVVLARCPSKYEAERTPESLSGQGHPTEVPRGQERP